MSNFELSIMIDWILDDEKHSFSIFASSDVILMYLIFLELKKHRFLNVIDFSELISSSDNDKQFWNVSCVIVMGWTVSNINVVSDVHDLINFSISL